MIDITIIIPVYGGENYILKTLQSLQAQTFRNYEVLCIDDWSPDDSYQIISKEMLSDPRIRLIKTNRNLGTVAKVMNFARDYVRGHYFVYSSQDDFFSCDWLEEMFAAAVRNDADATIPDLHFYYDDVGTVKVLSGVNGTRKELISGEEAFFLSLDWSIPGNALWKTKLILQYGFFDFGMFSDEYTARFYFLRCERVAFCAGVFYYYQGNPDAITKKISAKLLDAPFNEFRIWQLIRDSFPNSPWCQKYARQAVLTLMESLARVTAHPILNSERWRLDGAISEMQSNEFIKDLKRSFSRREFWKKFVFLAIVRNGPARSAVGNTLTYGRKVRRHIRLLLPY